MDVLSLWRSPLEQTWQGCITRRWVELLNKQFNLVDYDSIARSGSRCWHELTTITRGMYLIISNQYDWSILGVTIHRSLLQLTWWMWICKTSPTMQGLWRTIVQPVNRLHQWLWMKVNDRPPDHWSRLIITEHRGEWHKWSTECARASNQWKRRWLKPLGYQSRLTVTEHRGKWHKSSTSCARASNGYWQR